MTRDDVAIMLGTMREIYGTKGDGSDPKIMIELWYRYLCDEPREIVQMAFDEHVATNKFAPKPAEILELVEKAKWSVYEKTLYLDPFGQDGEKKLKEVPPEYIPRAVSRKQKQFQAAHDQRLAKNVMQLADKLRLE